MLIGICEVLFVCFSPCNVNRNIDRKKGLYDAGNPGVLVIIDPKEVVSSCQKDG